MKRLPSFLPAMLLIMSTILGCGESSNPLESDRAANELRAHSSVNELTGSFKAFSDDFEAGLDPAVWYAEYYNGAQWTHATEDGNGYIYCTPQLSPGSKRWTSIYTTKADFDNFVFTWDMRFRSQSYHKDSRCVFFRSDDSWLYPHSYVFYEGVKRPSPPYQYTDELSLSSYNPDNTSTSFVYMSCPWVLNQWYSFKLVADENVMMAKVWTKGDPEPENWIFAAVDTNATYSSGRIGFGNYWFGLTDVDNVNVEPLVCLVDFDIKPRSCPNALNVTSFDMKPGKNSKLKRGGVMPVAILGTVDFSVYDIDISTVELEGVAPLQHAYEDVAAPVLDGEECECGTARLDGYMDLTLKFNKLHIISALGSVSVNDVIPLEISGTLLDGTPFEGVDCVRIICKERELAPL